MAIRLKRAGIDTFTIYSKSHEAGGVWYENTYPGAACDVASSLYSYSFEPHWDWSRTHGTQPEIAAYLRHCVAKYALAPHLRFGTEIASAAYDEREALWRLAAADGREFAANVLVSACGLFNQPALPELPGLETFAGASFHSARWDHDYDLAGKRVAVIGTGCSTAQYVPEIVGKVSRLVAFIRTPQYVLPKIERTFDENQRDAYRRYPILRRLERIKTYVAFERRFAVFVDERARKAAEETALKFLTTQVKDPGKAPETHAHISLRLQAHDPVERLPARARPRERRDRACADRAGRAGRSRRRGRTPSRRRCDHLRHGLRAHRLSRLAPRRRIGRAHAQGGVAAGRRGLSRHHGCGLPQFLHALWPQHQHRDLDRRHARRTDRLHPEMHPPPRPGAGAQHDGAARSAGALQRRIAKADRGDELGQRLPQLFRQRRGPRRHAMAEAVARLSLADAPARARAISRSRPQRPPPSATSPSPRSCSPPAGSAARDSRHRDRSCRCRPCRACSRVRTGRRSEANRRSPARCECGRPS